jgi:hypothetical protein
VLQSEFAACHPCPIHSPIMSDLQPNLPGSYTALLHMVEEGVEESFALPSAMERELESTPSSGGSEELPLTRKRRASFELGDRKSACWNVFTPVPEAPGKARCLECNALLGMPRGCTSGLNRHVETRHPDLWKAVSVQKPAVPYRLPGDGTKGGGHARQGRKFPAPGTNGACG